MHAYRQTFGYWSMVRLASALAFVLAASPVHATEVRVIGLGAGVAEIVVNGSQVRSLRRGQRTPEGVELVELSRDAALFSIDGARTRLAIGDTNRPAVILHADRQGHFIAPVHINGRAGQALVDTGASSMAFSAGEARRLGLAYQDGQRVRVQTAGGMVVGYRIALASVQLGNILVTDVEAVVTENTDGPQFCLLGLSFLNRLEWQRSGDTLVLRKQNW